jgi:hypothetical protein
MNWESGIVRQKLKLGKLKAEIEASQVFHGVSKFKLKNGNGGSAAGRWPGCGRGTAKAEIRTRKTRISRIKAVMEKAESRQELQRHSRLNHRPDWHDGC